MLFIIYQVIFYLIQPIIWLRLLYINYKFPIHKTRWKEKYGFYNKTIKNNNNILLHSVSIGETLAAVPLIKALLHKYPEKTIIVTTTTISASKCILDIFGTTITHMYLPYDLYFSIYRFLNKTNPKLVIIMEKEIWPNLIIQIKKRKIPLIMINANLSDKSTNNYKLIKNFIKNILQKVTLIITDHQENTKNFIELGYAKKNIKIIGNLKFDLSIDQQIKYKTIALKKYWNLNRPVWIAASTHKGEEIIILQTHKKLLEKFSNLLLILVPRHPTRFHEVINITKKFNLQFILRSENKSPNLDTKIIIADSIGELLLLYSISNIAFIGGSLIKHGGHNPLEAAINSIPIITGPHIFNFRHICYELTKNKAILIIKNQNELIRTIIFLLKNKKICINYGRNAYNSIIKNRGITKKILKIITKFIK